MKFTLLGVAWLFSSSVLLAPLTGPAAWASRTAPVTVQLDGKKLQGTLHVPDQADARKPLPLVVVVHEWWGKNDYPEMRARRIADELGYAALAVDLYGRVVNAPDEAQAAAKPFYEDPEKGVRIIDAFIDAVPAAASALKSKVDLTRTAAIGYCFGGSQVLNLARAGDIPGPASLLGVVSFHGGLTSTLKAREPVSARILVLHGKADPTIKPEEITHFKEEMKKAGAQVKFIEYPHAKHAFTNPQATELGKRYGMPVAYDRNADTKSWDEMKTFLNDLFSSK